MTAPVPKPQRIWKFTAASPKGVVRILDGEGIAVLHVASGVSAVVISSAMTIEVVLDEGAHLELLRCHIYGKDEQREVSLQVHQAKDTYFKTFLMTRGARSFKDQVSIILKGPGAEVSLNGLHDLKGEAVAQSHTFIDHAAPATLSNQLYKSVVRDSSHSVFNGKIMVRREAQLTNAYQLNKNLILGALGRAETKPQLEIFADDVKCSHGATIGQLDDDQLFYFQTRGISREEAGRMLINGFTEDVVSSINDLQLRAEVGGLL
ncbi:MAG: SufD family Fe-S cluster assembly protein [Candidatus Omnitrophota bacterium]